MALTSANFDQLLINRLAVKLAYAGLDSTTVDGTNPSLADGRVDAFRSLGLTPASVMNLVDADLAGVADASIPQLLDVAELRTLENILGNRASPDQMADTDNQQWHGKFYDSLEKTVERKRKQVERQYGYGLSTLTPGVFDLGFAETIDQATGIPD
jgi:hypothetical protein